nr:hypothetical protein BaRGS_032130 [Batillaria attramentaria]
MDIMLTPSWEKIRISHAVKGYRKQCRTSSPDPENPPVPRAQQCQPVLPAESAFLMVDPHKEVQAAQQVMEVP